MKKAALGVLVLGLLAAVSAQLMAAGAPATVVLGSIADKYQPVKFDHAMHTYVMESCGQCHHEHPRVKNLTCQNCHSIDKGQFKSSVTMGFMACKNCHGDYNPSNPSMPGLKAAYHQACFECHRDMGDVGQGPQGCTQKCHGPA
ncbi:MAG: hypothetical protein Kow0025_02830 [Thermodesulfovibrionales bacterium]